MMQNAHLQHNQCIPHTSLSSKRNRKASRTCQQSPWEGCQALDCPAEVARAQEHPQATDLAQHRGRIVHGLAAVGKAAPVLLGGQQAVHLAQDLLR